MPSPPARYDDLTALFVNCTLKPSPQVSNTEGLMAVARQIMRDRGVAVETVRFVDHKVAPGILPDMRGHGFEDDDWPQIWRMVEAADILVIGTPIWLGEESSQARKLIERLYAHSGQRNEKGQQVFYGKTGGCVVTGNEDGIKHIGMTVLYALQHVGFAIPPEADAGWIGPVGPGPSYLDEESGGPQHDFTQRHITFLSWNLMHMARLLKDAGGFPAFGNDPKAWAQGKRFGHPG